MSYFKIYIVILLHRLYDITCKALTVLKGGSTIARVFVLPRSYFE